MGRLLDILTGRAGKVFPDWVGEVHDAECRFKDITFDATTGTLSIRCWRPVNWSASRDSVWEELLIQFEGLTSPPTINRQETLPYYELSTVHFDPAAKRIHICLHAGLSIHYPAVTPSYSFRGPTGQRRNREQDFA